MAVVMEVGQMAQMILSVAKEIFDIVQEVRHFKHRSRRLNKRVENLTPAIEKLASSAKKVPPEGRTLDQGLKLFSKPLGEMLQLFGKIRDFIQSLQTMNFVKKLLHKDTIGTEFDEYSEELACLSSTIHLSLTVEMREVEKRGPEDREDQENDVMDLILELEKGQEQILKEMEKQANGQEEIKKILEIVAAHLQPKSEEKNTIRKQHRIEGLQQIDRNQLTEKAEIGAGYFGKTYKAKYMHEMVAVKSYTTGDQDVIRKVLVREATNLVKLNSTYIVRLWGVCTQIDPCLLVFEYMAKGNLRAVLDNVGADRNKLSWEKRIQMALDGSLGLYRMHNITPRPLLHQDLGSDNFLVDENWRMKISGVGFAQTQTSILRKSKQALNSRSTLNYVSPERLDNFNIHPGASTDVYSYGIVMWEIATGAKPYAGLEFISNMEISDFVLTQKRKLELTEDCPKGFKDLIDQCRNFDPTIRPASSEIVDKLQKLRSSLGCEKRPGDSV